MTVSEYLEQVLAEPEKAEKNFAEIMIGERLTGDVKKITDHMDSDIRFDDKTAYFRLMSRQEVEDCEKDTGVAFSKYSLLPLIDLAENDYICYQYRDHAWSMFNTVDELVFVDRQSMELCLDICKSQTGLKKGGGGFPDDMEQQGFWTKIDRNELAILRIMFCGRKHTLIKEWERTNPHTWPTYQTDVSFPNGKRIRHAGDRYDAHHIRPLSLGGTDEAENITPVHIQYHFARKDIHARDGTYGELEELGEILASQEKTERQGNNARRPGVKQEKEANQMKFSEYLQQIFSEPEQKETNFAERMLGKRLKGEIKKLTDHMEEDPVFFDEEGEFFRLLCREEAENCREELGVDLSEYGLIPLVDVMDNDYICYRYKGKGDPWCIFNTGDEESFDEWPTLLDCVSSFDGEDEEE